MSAMQAAMGRVQLARLDELIGRKREIFGWYRDRLEDVEGLPLNAEPDGVHCSFWMSTVVLDDTFAMTNDVVLAGCAARGTPARPFFPPLSALPPTGAPRIRRAERQHPRLAGRSGSIFRPPYSSRSDVDTVCEIVARMSDAAGPTHSDRG